MTHGRTLLRLSSAALTSVAVACGGDEVQAAPDHTPVTYNVLANGVQVSSPYTFVAGQTVRVRLKLFNAAGDDLDVLAPAVGSGTMQVSFGHDEMTDEKSFDPVAVNVLGSASPVK